MPTIGRATTVLIARESRKGEHRVAAVPETLKQLVRAGLEVAVQEGAGVASGFGDPLYEQAGARIVDPNHWQGDLVLKVQCPTLAEIDRLQQESILISFGHVVRHGNEIKRLAQRRISMLAMDLIPRITRAQPMDALSSQATIAGYKAVLLAADHLKKLCPLLMTAAGTIPPARVVIFGAGVAGLQAVATARRLGCVVAVSDVRHVVKEQVESLGARFLSVAGARDQEGAGGYAVEADEQALSRQREAVQKHLAEADIVITTALVPFARAPILVDEAMVRSMRPHSVLVDLAVESGGNCTLTERGAIVEKHGVTLIGLENLPSLVPTHASELYARNVLALVRTLVGEKGALQSSFEDEIHAGCLLTHRGEIVHAAARERLPMEPVMEVGS